MAKRYYFRIKSSGKCGCANYTSWRYTDTCNNKAEVKRRFGYGKTIQITEDKQDKAICWD